MCPGWCNQEHESGVWQAYLFIHVCSIASTIHEMRVSNQALRGQTEAMGGSIYTIRHFEAALHSTA